MAIGDEAKWNGASVNAIAKRLAKDGSLVSVSDMVSRFDGINPEIGYPVAGSFVAFLVKTHGMASVVEFFRACPRGGSTEVAFEGAFGQSLTSAGAAWMASL